MIVLTYVGTYSQKICFREKDLSSNSNWRKNNIYIFCILTIDYIQEKERLKILQKIIKKKTKNRNDYIN